LTILGYHGRAHIDAAGQASGGKAIWVIAGNDTRIENFELSGAQVRDQNGAGIRQEGAGLTVVGSFFHDNQDGILAGDNPNSDIVVDSTEFARNGAGDGQSHNFYINHVRSFTLRYSWSHDASIGHLAKSRAYTNYFLYNRLTGEGGTDSYELDLPNAGRSYVIGNVIQQGPKTDNPAMIAYGEEGNLNPDSRLYVVSNTFVNNLGRGPSVRVGDAVTEPVLVQNNLSVGSDPLVTQAAATLRTNCTTSDPRFTNAAGYDYHLQGDSPCIGTASPVGSAEGFALAPTEVYAHPTRHQARTAEQQRDAGAYGHGGPSASTSPTTPSSSSSSSSPSAAATTTTASSAVVPTPPAPTRTTTAGGILAKRSATVPDIEGDPMVATQPSVTETTASSPISATPVLAITGSPVSPLLETALACLAAGVLLLFLSRRHSAGYIARHRR
jgi:hypothetical protein